MNKTPFIVKEVPDYIKESFEETSDLKPCPRCGSKYVFWSSTRDLNVLEQSVCCEACELTTFRVETMAFEQLPNLDYETSVMKYNAWVDTNPNQYREEKW